MTAAVNKTIITIRIVLEALPPREPLAELSFDPVKTTLHVTCQFVHPEADHFPTRASQLSIAEMII
jgi:hypothetical protein